MEPSTYFFLVFLFGACNVLLFVLVAFFVINMGRQQRRLQSLSRHLEELVTDLNAAVEHLEEELPDRKHRPTADEPAGEGDTQSP